MLLDSIAAAAIRTMQMLWLNGGKGDFEGWGKKQNKTTSDTKYAT